jgi:hypothetical protein
MPDNIKIELQAMDDDQYSQALEVVPRHDPNIQTDTVPIANQKHSTPTPASSYNDLETQAEPGRMSLPYDSLKISPLSALLKRPESEGQRIPARLNWDRLIEEYGTVPQEPEAQLKKPYAVEESIEEPPGSFELKRATEVLAVTQTRSQIEQQLQGIAEAEKERAENRGENVRDSELTLYRKELQLIKEEFPHAFMFPTLMEWKERMYEYLRIRDGRKGSPHASIVEWNIWNKDWRREWIGQADFWRTNEQPRGGFGM